MALVTPDERRLLLTYCNAHPVAVCPQCSEALTFDRIGSDIISGKRDFCPMCRADLATALREHLAECTLTRIQARELLDRARQAARDAAPNGSESLNETREAVLESERLRVREENRVLTAATDSAIIRHGEYGQPSTPGPA